MINITIGNKSYSVNEANTDDRTGLTKTLKQGGTIEFKNIINYKNEKN